jgi:D-ribose pyranose/furanose isomerase RbsD
MATYISGVTDYIPQFQPFQPDLNFYANALQTKQNQYDTNYKALNNVYGQYFYADLTHGDNLKKKDELIKAIDFNLKRVSGLDLSLEQNVTQAQQVFKPFYEDKHLMKDIAWTKNINSQKTYGAGLKNARDEKLRAQYWDAGVRALDYKTEEFKNASLEETMNIGNASYTPYVNVMEKAQKIAKDAGLSVETVDFSPDGKWIVKTKNGEQLIPKLSHLFEATLGSDPAVIDVYKTQAYVNRKDYAYSNAAQFGGDQNAAEMSYLSESYKMLKAENEARLAKLQNNSKVYDKKAADVEKSIEEGDATPESNDYLTRLQEAKQVNNTLLTNTDNNVNSLSERSGTLTTSTGFENPYGDVESLRWKVDNAMASRLMQKDLGEAANVFAFKDAKQDINANPYAVQQIAHQYRMQEVASANASREKAANIARQTEIDKERVATGAWEWDRDPNSSTYNQAIPRDEANLLTVAKKSKGTSTDIVNLNEQSAKYTSNQITDKVVPYVTNMLVSIRELQKQGKLSNSDIKTIFGNTGMSAEKLNAQLQSDPYKLITKTLGTTKLKQITNGFQQVIKQNYNKGVKGFDAVGQQMSSYNIDLNDYYTYVSDLQNWRKESKDAVVDYVKSTIDKDIKGYVDKMYDKNGNLLSESEFNKIFGFVSSSPNSEVIQVGSQPLMGGSGKGFNSTQDYTKSKMSPGKSVSPYKELKRAIHKAYGSTNVKFTSAPPQLTSIGQFKDAGLTTIGEHGVQVYPDDKTSAGAFGWETFKNDFNNLDFDADADVSFVGPTTTGAKRNKEGKLLIQEMFKETSEPGGKFRGFRLAAQPLAQNKAGKGAMIIYPDSEWLKKHTYTESGEGENYKKGPGIISAKLARYIAENGISITADERKWKNSIYEATKITPFEAHVNYSKGPVTINDPNDDLNMNSITFEKDNILGGYSYNFKFKQWDPQKNAYIQKEVADHVYTGQELENARVLAYRSWPVSNKSNNEIFNSNR